MLSEEALALVHGIASRPERNGTCVKLGKRRHADTENERWESFDEFTGAEAQYRPGNLTLLPPMQPLAQSLYRMLTTPFLTSHGTSNDLFYHVLSHGHELPLMHLSLLVEKRVAKALPLAPRARLEAMRAAALELSTCHTGFALSRSDTNLRRPPLPEGSQDAATKPAVDVSVELTALLIRAAADALPSAITLSHERVDFLHALAERLDAPSVAPYPLGKNKGSQRFEQPVLYAPIGTDEVDARPLNQLASALAGVEVRGDALLTSLEFRDSAGVEGLLSMREPCDLPSVIRQLQRRTDNVVDFVGVKLGRPLLGARTIPRVEAWPVGVEVSGVPCPSPKSLLLEYCQAWPQHAQLARAIRVCAVGPDGVSPPDAGMPPRGFRASFSIEWPAGAPPPEGAARSDDGTTISMQTSVYPRKAVTKQDQKRGQSAEPQATVMLLRALHQRNQLSANAAAAAASSAAAAVSPIFHGMRLLSGAAPAVPDGQQPGGAHATGSMLTVSYTLKLLPRGASALPEAGAEDSLLTLEARAADRVLLGGGVLGSEIEEVLEEMAVDAERRLLVHATLLAQPVHCLLWLRLHACAPPAELDERRRFDARRPAGAMTNSQERAAFVAELIAEWAPCSLVDVGCGSGQMMGHLVSSCVPVRCMLGVDVLERELRRAGRLLSHARARALEPPPEGGPSCTPPRVELLNVGLAELRVACDAMILVEVIEHLDSWDLERIGPVLLGVCAPRRLLVTTPNKEYNLNYAKPYDGWQEGTAVPDVNGYQLRNEDHRFEWKRDEFREWAEGLARDFGYTASFHGIGGGPLDEHVPYGVWRGPGPETQAVVFEKIAGAQQRLQQTSAPLHEHTDSVVWRSP